MVTGKYYEGVGRRKSAVARVRLFAGSGVFTVNEKPVNEYFPISTLLASAMSPLKVTANEARFTVSAQVKGGGPTGQADAVALGLARALLAADATLKSALRKAGLLTRDPREKERKKPGLKKARKAKQYTKR
jgi:small subunit ribosomal protein S9